MRKAFLFIALILSSWSTEVSAICPDLSQFYTNNNGSPRDGLDWERIHSRLTEIFDQCLRSSEYFALYGAAQLNTDRLSDSMESLERSLLLDPDNGAALIDYAEALLRDGQLFAAIEANAILLMRDDVPDELSLQINQRQQDWSALIRQTNWQLDLLGGFDNNLNGAPDEELITLTLSGEPIFLRLNEAYRAIGGAFLNANLLVRHQRLTPESQHSFLGQLRGRLSKDNASDVLQVAGRYNRVLSGRENNVQWGVGLNHLLFTGRPLFTGTDARYSHQLGRIGKCRRLATGALQHQIWHEQRRLDGLEIKTGIGASCPLSGSSAQQISLEGSILHNAELNGSRLGGNRSGFQLTALWQAPLSQGTLSAQFNHTRLLDDRGFSPLIESNARRAVERSSVFVQYQRDIEWPGNSVQFLVRLYHQDQNSNVGLFETEDTSFELGVSWRF